MDIQEYATKDGRYPFSEWIDGLQDKKVENASLLESSGSRSA